MSEDREQLVLALLREGWSVNGIARKKHLCRRFVKRVRDAAGITPAAIVENAGRTTGFIGELEPVGKTTPTTSLPGTPEKVLVLAARAAQGQPLWHEKDRVDWGEA